jgi:ribulose bisphosphate carboxylase small subunit
MQKGGILTQKLTKVDNSQKLVKIILKQGYYIAFGNIYANNREQKTTQKLPIKIHFLKKIYRSGHT